MEAQASTNGVVAHLEAQADAEAIHTPEEKEESQPPEAVKAEEEEEEEEAQAKEQEQEEQEEEEEEEEEEDSDDVRQGSALLLRQCSRVSLGCRNHHGTTITVTRLPVCYILLVGSAFKADSYEFRQRTAPTRGTAAPTTPSRREYLFFRPL